jgi:DNA mismatch repair protein MutS
VLARAREVLAELESERTVDHLARGATPRAPAALPLFQHAQDPVAEALENVDPERLTPLEALQLLVDWKQRFGGNGSGR